MASQNDRAERKDVKVTFATDDLESSPNIGEENVRKKYSRRRPYVRGGEDTEGERGGAPFSALHYRQQMALFRDAMVSMEMRMDRIVRLVHEQLEVIKDSLDAINAKLSKDDEEVQGNSTLQSPRRRVVDFQHSCGGGSENSGVFLWRIANYSARKADTKEHKTDTHSAPFFSSAYGYKMCAAVDFTGDGAGEGTHLSVYVCLMKGPYDDILAWPFQHKVTFVLMDQSDGSNDTNNKKNHLMQTLIPDVHWVEFRKPIFERNMGRGFHRFVSHQVLESDNVYLKNDTIFLKIIVHNN